MIILMPSFPHARDGTPVKYGGHPIRFFLYSPARSNPQTGRMLASNPWKCMELHFAEQRKTASISCSFLHQAFDFYQAAAGAGPTSQPVLLYYSFLNLAKAIIVHKNPAIDLRRSLHGLNEPASNIRQRFTLTSQKVAIQGSRAGRIAIVNEFVRTLGYSRLQSDQQWNVCDLLAQMPAIHRPYSHTRQMAERLFVISDPVFLHDHQARRVWALLRVRRSEFASGIMRTRLVGRRYFARAFSQVESDAEHQNSYSFESRPIYYGLSPMESLHRVCRMLRRAGTVSILTPAGYRYYLSDFEPRVRVPPFVAAYMAMFYFGSVARYRPLDLEKMRNGKFAWVIEEMLATQSEQFVYFAASELLGREVAKPWAIQRGGPLR
jgi:YaaC-like protein